MTRKGVKRRVPENVDSFMEIKTRVRKERENDVLFKSAAVL